MWEVCKNAQSARTCCLCLCKGTCDQSLCALQLEAKVPSAVQQFVSLLCWGACHRRSQAGAKQQTCRASQARCTEHLTRGQILVVTPPIYKGLAAGGAYGAALWRLPPSGGELERVAELRGHAGAVRAAAWHAAAPDALVSLDEGHLRIWRLRDGAAQACCT